MFYYQKSHNSLNNDNNDNSPFIL